MSRLLFLISVLLMLAGCSGEECYDADDFGFANLVVSSRYTKEEMEGQHGENQVAPWINSTYRVNGRPLAILIKHWDYDTNNNRSSEVSAWCPWFGDVGHEHKLSDFCHRLQDCSFIDNDMCTNTPDARIGNAPCIFRKGIGLYALITERGYDPNVSLTSMRQPEGISYHLGVPPVGYEWFDITKNGEIKDAGGRVYLYDDGTLSADTLKQTYADGLLYFKILDKYYDDNNGQYRISIKSGVHAVNPDPISFAMKLVKEFMFGEGGDDYGLIQRIYQGIIDNANYRIAVSALLTLFVMYTGMAYLTGNIELSQTELIIRVGKIAIISALISTEQSWSFFYDYLFAFFVGGVEQILQMIMSAGASGPGASGILAMMIAPQTLAKLFSLLFVDWRGFIYIILFLIALAFVIKVFFDAAVIYLTALMAVGLIIVMAPIFLCFMLFSFTRSLFENWFKQLISYAVQPIILFTGLVFISFIIREELYGALGFRVCKHYFPELSEEADLFGELTEETLGVDLGRSPFYWWFPNPMKGEEFTRNLATIPIPIDHFDTSTGEFCEAYGCFGERYPDLPFLDPNTDRGQSRIEQFHNGDFVQLDGLLLIFLAVYMLSKFNTLTISMSKFITGTSGSFTDIGKVQQSGISGSSHSFKSFGGIMKREFRRTEMGRQAHGKYQEYKRKKKELKKKPAQLFDKYAIKRLEKQALSSGFGNKASKAILAEVEKETGLRQQDIVKGSKERYRAALAEKLRQMDSNLTEKEAAQLAKKLSKTNYKNLHRELARQKYGKEFEQLTQQQQAELRNMMSSKYGDLGDKKSLRELAINAKNEARFKKAYVDAHQSMSHRGISVFGKSNQTIRSLEEIKYGAKRVKKERKQDRILKGERVMSGIEGFKSDAYESVTGEGADKRDLGKKFFGGGYHDIDKKDPGLRTYDENLKEQREERERDKLERKIAAISEKEGTSVISPEFLSERKRLNDPDFGGYRELARQGVASQVHQELNKGKNPIMKGDKYMYNYAKDSELVEMVDRAQALKGTIFERDQFISREDEYELRLEKAEEAIRKDIESYGDAFEGKLEPEIMGDQLEYYLQRQGRSESEASAYGRKLEKHIAEYQEAKRVLDHIDDRKLMVIAEIDKEIDHINKARVKSGMKAYPGEQDKELMGQYEIRKERKIEDLMSGPASGGGYVEPTQGLEPSSGDAPSVSGAGGDPSSGSGSSGTQGGSDSSKANKTIDIEKEQKKQLKTQEQEKKDIAKQVKKEKEQQKLEQQAYKAALSAQREEEKRRELEGKMKESEKKSRQQQAAASQDAILKDDEGHRTASEISRSIKEEDRRRELDSKIQDLANSKGEDILAPEYLAAHQQDKDIATYKDIVRYKAQDDVHRELTYGDNPVIKGEKYMREQANEAELANIIDNVREAEQRIIREDKYISKQTEYEARAERAQKAIEQNFANYREAFGQDVNPNKMPEQLQSYLIEQGMEPAQVREQVQQLQGNIQDYQQSQQVLQQIDSRKEMIASQVNKEIDNINDIRRESGMDEYSGSKVEYQAREERKIEDYLRANKPADQSREGSDSPDAEARTQEAREQSAEYQAREERKIEDNLRQSAQAGQSRADNDRLDTIGRTQEARLTSPEYIASHLGDSNVAEYMELARQEVQDQVHRDLTGGDEPIIRDQQYMREQATDQELANMIGRALAYERQAFEQDEFIRHEKDYESRVEQAQQEIERDFAENREAFGQEIVPEKMPEQLQSYLTKQGREPQEVQEKVQHLQENLAEYKSSQQVLQQIDNRKDMVASQINKEIDKINEVRKDAGMQEYNIDRAKADKPAAKLSHADQLSLSKKDLKKTYRAREERKIDDFLRKKDKK